MLWIPEANDVIPISKGKYETLAKSGGIVRTSEACYVHFMKCEIANTVFIF